MPSPHHEPDDTRELSVAGCHGGTYPASWAQQSMHEFFELTGYNTAYNVRMAVPLDGVKDLSRVEKSIEVLLDRHDALRTSFRTDVDGRLLQEIRPAIALSIPVYVSSGSDPGKLCSEVVELLAAEKFSSSRSAPRIALIVAEGRPAFLAMAFSHVALDGVAAGILGEEAHRLSLDLGSQLPDSWQPWEIAGYEREHESKPAFRRASLFIREQLTKVAQDGILASRQAEWAMLAEVAFDSQAIAAAALRLANTYSISAATVILAAYALAVSEHFQTVVCGLMLACSNRADRRMRASIANLSQTIPIAVETRSGDFAQVLGHVRSLSFLAYRYGHHDPACFGSLLSQVRHETDSHFTIPHSANLRTIGVSGILAGSDKAHGELQSLAGLRPHEIRGLAKKSFLQTLPGHPGWSRGGVSFNLWGLSDVAQMTLEASSMDSRDLMGIFLRMEEILLHHACDLGTSNRSHANGLS